ncbi:hypothetical protein J5N97_000933 [Dioscorea zingiberensis]|uniref:Uncharacterized protein n=1 Tax=Dioscorea zingiberensis TaxID=325984 RepID=A0A9D5BV23_9LILI|nr:hypothetical protein J5N97_000933 [Dioscorea zingiberensis]
MASLVNRFSSWSPLGLLEHVVATPKLLLLLRGLVPVANSNLWNLRERLVRSKLAPCCIRVGSFSSSSSVIARPSGPGPSVNLSKESSSIATTSSCSIPTRARRDQRDQGDHFKDEEKQEFSKHFLACKLSLLGLYQWGDEALAMEEEP